MTKTSKTIVFFGNERLVSGLPYAEAPTLQGLLDAGYHIAAIVAHHSDSRSRSNRPLEVASIAKEYHIPLLTPNKPSEIKEKLENLKADVGVLAAYGKIIPQSIIDIFPHGIINIHPSLLPKHRGPTPIEATITSGDKEAGVSIMQLTKGMDEGPLYGQTKIPLQGTETKFDLYQTLTTEGARLLLELLPSILNGTKKPIPQDHSKATYSGLFTKEDAWLNTETLSAPDAERRVRAHLRFPKSKVVVNGRELIITKAHITNHKKTPLDLECNDGAFLSVDELVVPNGKAMSSQEYMQGYLRS